MKDFLLSLASLYLVLFVIFLARISPFGQDLVNGFKAARRQRKMIEAARKADARYKANRPTPARIGTISRDECGNFVLHEDWSWNIKVEHTPYPVVRFDLDGTWRAFGYTQRELEEIHARRAEWNA